MDNDDIKLFDNNEKELEALIPSDFSLLLFSLRPNTFTCFSSTLAFLLLVVDSLIVFLV